MIRPIQRADGVRFQLYARRDGRKVYLGTFDSEREAKEALEEHRSHNGRSSAASCHLRRTRAARSAQP